ncbi:MAG: radical SAM protein [Thermodesulfobacteriota bacterium]|nr:radical SAM protein [Thermodesulfobacteriota bacterium]
MGFPGSQSPRRARILGLRIQSVFLEAEIIAFLDRVRRVPVSGQPQVKGAKSMSYVFGPVRSRRLGLSLGVDLIPKKTCSFDCLYCQVGRTSFKTIETKTFIHASGVVKEVAKRLLKGAPDVITLAGSGEPTLCSEIDRVIASIKEMTDIKVAVLTNGSLFWREEIRRRVLKADIIMPTLCTAFEHTFRRIHRPHSQLDLGAVVNGLKHLRRNYRGQLLLEVVFLAGINDSENEVEGLKTLIDQIIPEKIHLNTVVRPPSDPGALPLDRKRLEAIETFLGPRAEIVAEVPPVAVGAGKETSSAIDLLDVVKRRPLTPADMATTLKLSLEEVEDILKGLLIKGLIHRLEHSGTVYYLSDKRDA